MNYSSISNMRPECYKFVLIFDEKVDGSGDGV
jgi:hypothetical protein